MSGPEEAHPNHSKVYPALVLCRRFSYYNLLGSSICLTPFKLKPCEFLAFVRRIPTEIILDLARVVSCVYLDWM